MSERTEIFVIPSKKFDCFYVTPISLKESDRPEHCENLIAAEFSKILSPSEARRVISRIHANNVIENARKILQTNRAYIHSLVSANFAFVSSENLKTEGDAYKLSQLIDAEPHKFPSNDLFSDKIKML